MSASGPVVAGVPGSFVDTGREPGREAGWVGRAWPKSELSPGACIAYAFAWQAVSLVLISAQLFLLCEFGVLTLLLGMIGLSVLYLRKPLAGVTVFLQILLYQNWLLSVFSGLGMDRVAFQATQAMAFVAVTCMSAIAVARLLQSPPLQSPRRDDPAVRLTRWTCITLGVILLYTAYGVPGSSVASAMAYSRNTSAMLLALLVGLDLGRSWGYRTVTGIFLISVVFGVCLSTAEMLFPYTYYTAINAVAFVNLKLAAAGSTDFAYSVDGIVRSRLVTWFNITGGGTDLMSVRIGGPNMHPISYAYVIGVTGIVAATTRRFVVVGLCTAFLLTAGVKGPLLMLLFSIALFAVWWMTRQRSLLLIASVVSLIAYIGTGIWFGLSRGDFHVLGFLGGLHSVLTMPQGHGIGVGGNLSALAGEGLDWDEWQKSGVDFALESAVGVLLYQMGICSIAVFAPAVGLVKAAFRRTAGSRPARPALIDGLFIGIAVTLANGVFQEEAYSPFGLGLLTLFGAVAVSNRFSTKRLRGN